MYILFVSVINHILEELQGEGGREKETDRRQSERDIELREKQINKQADR